VRQRSWGNRHYVRNIVIGAVLSLVSFYAFYSGLGIPLPQAFWTEFSDMDNFNWLLQGFAEAATPMNLLYAVIGVLLGTAVGVLPGIGPAMTVALLLPITYNVSPSAAFHHVRGHLLRRHVWRIDNFDSVEHTGRVVVGDHGDRRQQDGQGRPGRAGAGHRGHRLLRGRRHRHRVVGGLRAADIEIRRVSGRAVVPRDHAVRPGGGNRRAGCLQAARGNLAVPRFWRSASSASTSSRASHARHSAFPSCPMESTSW